MLYAVLGALLEKAAVVVRSDAVTGGGEHADVQRRRVAAFIARVGRMWPGVFPALIRQNAVLATALAESSRALGHDAAALAQGEAGQPTGDPVADHRRLLTEIERQVVAFHAAGDEQWAVTARRRLRCALRESARIEMALVEGITNS